MGGPTSTNGYAVIHDGEIDIRTVHESPRAAIVNWLVMVPGVMVQNDWTDQMIEERWQQEKDSAECVKVKIFVEQ